VEGGAATATDRCGAGSGGAGDGRRPCCAPRVIHCTSRVPGGGKIASPRISSQGVSAASRSAVDSGQAVARLVRIDTDPPGASVLLESGASIGKTPLEMDVTSLAGRKVVLSKEGYERRSVPADALSAGSAFRTELLPLIGTVEAIQAIPWAKVYLGNRLLGETPLTGVRLPAGEQRLRFVNEPLGVDQVKIVVVRPGDNPKIIVR